jgi:hypothetical protein
VQNRPSPILAYNTTCIMSSSTWAERENKQKNLPAKNVRNWRETRIRNSRTKWCWPSFESLKFFAEELPVDFFLSFFREFGSAVLRVEGFRAILSSSRARARAVVWKRKSWIIFQNLLAKVGRRGGVGRER